MDITEWYPSERHEYGPHEMTTGDIAAAVYYQNINYNNEAEWLTDYFRIPTFNTGSPFVFNWSHNESNSICNPVWTDQYQPTGYIPGTGYYSISSTGNDTAWSSLDDGKLAVTVYYEVVDLGEQDANGVGGSPITFRDPNGTPVFCYSERYVLLLTYKFKNLSTTSDVNGLEFYQMLHGHPAFQTYNTHGMYETANFYDSLSNYLPCDSNHQVGNFRYDITLWNSGDPQTEHVDWMSISSTIEPVDYGFNYFGDYNYYLYMGADIKSRNLNDVNNLYGNEVAGAMKWYIGNLGPLETKSITLALMYGVGPIQHTPPIPPLPDGIEVDIFKDDGLDEGDCVGPSTQTVERDINYTIDYFVLKTDIFDENNIEVNDVTIVDFLPTSGVDFISAEPNYYCDYNEAAKTVTWYIGDVNTGSGFGVFDTLTLKVKIREDCPQGSPLTNTVYFYSGGNLIKTDAVDTNICCENIIIYVRQDANEGGDGRSWQTAYKELRDALTNITLCTEQIWVAAGTYYPTEANDPSPGNKTFTLIDGIDIYGHFAGWESSIDQRNLADTNNTTTLSGDVDDDNDTGDVSNVVTAADCIFDGFTVTKGTQKGIYCYGSTTTIKNCIVKNNNNNGISCENGSNVNIINTFVNTNASHGINCSDSGTQVNIDRCTIASHNSDGIAGIMVNSGSIVNVTDSIITGNYNGISGDGVFTVERCDVVNNSSGGISCNGSAEIRRCNIQNHNYGFIGDNALLMGNIIANNNVGVYGGNNLVANRIYSNNYGIYATTSNADIIYNTIVDNDTYGILLYYADPNIHSNIIWGNTNGLNGTSTKVNYNCIQDYPGGDGIGNTDENPQLSNYHLMPDSTSCIDKGDPNFVAEQGETDIDDEPRIVNGRTDIGSDEFYVNDADFNEDGIVNSADLLLYSDYWLEDVNSSMPADFNDNNFINFEDFAVFAQNWQWNAAWPDNEILLAEDFENGIPNDWTLIDDYNDGKTWRTDNPGYESSSYWTGNACIADSYFGEDADMNEMLITSAVDCNGTLGVTLKFSHDFSYSGWGDANADVDISINNGPWQTILQYTDSSSGNITEDISGIAADQSNVRIRWHYNGYYWAGYWGIDNIEIIGNYRMPPIRCVGRRGAYFEDTGSQIEMMMSEQSEPELLLMPAQMQAEAMTVVQVEPLVVDVNQVLDWLDELWKSDEDFKESMSEEEYLEFRKSIDEESEE
ncbi:MAG: right-handed parallel beta-helix repeat-containing protein [Phycisphaerae bacterium]